MVAVIGVALLSLSVSRKHQFIKHLMIRLHGVLGIEHYDMFYDDDANEDE